MSSNFPGFNQLDEGYFVVFFDAWKFSPISLADPGCPGNLQMVILLQGVLQALSIMRGFAIDVHMIV